VARREAGKEVGGLAGTFGHGKAPCWRAANFRDERNPRGSREEIGRRRGHASSR
jgi:hypothetical protein